MLSEFTFKKISSGCYRVTYETKRGDYYVAEINDMTIIDATLYEETPKQEDIKHLKNMVKRLGGHYHKDGNPFEW